MAFCGKCGHKLQENQKFCPKCGNPIRTAVNQVPVQNEKLEEIVAANPTIEVIEEKAIENHAEEATEEKVIENPTIEKVEAAAFNPSAEAESIVNTSEEKLPENPIKKEAEAEKALEQTKLESAASAPPVQNITVPQIPQRPQPSSTPSKKSTSFFKKIWVRVVLAVVLVLGILTGVFFKQVKGGYYLLRYKLEKSTDKKFEYAGEALKGLNISSAYNAFRETAGELMKERPDMVEAKLNELSGKLKPEDEKTLRITVYDKMATNYSSSQNYGAAFSSLVKLQNNGGNLRDNPNYETIMLNVIADTLGTGAYSDRATLKEKANIIFENLDGDPFDEIIEIKDLYPNDDLHKQYDINLYRLQEGKYVKADMQKTEDYDYLGSFGIYNYDKDKKGLYISTSQTGYVSATVVYAIQNSKFKVVGMVGSADPCEILDYDKDGIYEVSTTELYDPAGQASHADMPRIVRYYKFSDQKAPWVVKEERPTINQPTASNNDYIFPDSDKRYLTASEVSTLSKEMLGYARNEIFARHGYVFKTDKYAQYFSSKSWYRQDPNFEGGSSSFNQYENANIKLIQEYEK